MALTRLDASGAVDAGFGVGGVSTVDLWASRVGRRPARRQAGDRQVVPTTISARGSGRSAAGRRPARRRNHPSAARPAGAAQGRHLGLGIQLGGSSGTGNTSNRLLAGEVNGLTNVAAVAADADAQPGAPHRRDRLGLGCERESGSSATGRRSTQHARPGQRADQRRRRRRRLLHNLALRTDGTVWAWGSNWAGAARRRDDAAAHHAVQVSGLTDVVAVAAGSDTAWRSAPTGPSGPGGATGRGSSVTGRRSSAPLPSRSAGSPMSPPSPPAPPQPGAPQPTAPSGPGGPTGTGSSATGRRSSAPARPVSGLTNVAAIAAGGIHSLALRTDGTVWAWGCERVRAARRWDDAAAHCAGPGQRADQRRRRRRRGGTTAWRCAATGQSGPGGTMGPGSSVTGRR